MDERSVIRSVADHFLYDGVEPPDPLVEPWRTIWFRADAALRLCRTVAEAVRHACHGLPSGRALERALLRAMPSGAEYESLDQRARSLPPIDWLWPGWIPRGMMSLLAAGPGVGKSLVALDLARRLIHGLEWPDGVPVGEAGSACLYVDAEGVPQIQNQRAQAWGMDRRRLYLMEPPGAYGMIDLGCEEQQDRLVDMCSALSPRLVVVDALGAVSLRGENNVEDVRSLLAFLASLAREFECGLLLVHHLRKRGPLSAPGGVALDDLRGSGHIMAVARSVLALSLAQAGPHPDRNGPRRLEVIKTNLCAYPPALGLELERSDPRAPALRYGPSPAGQDGHGQTDECARWLLHLLGEAGRPLRPKEVLAMAGQIGYPEAMVYRARKALEGRLVDTRGKRAQGNRWALAGRGEGLSPSPSGRGPE